MGRHWSARQRRWWFAHQMQGGTQRGKYQRGNPQHNLRTARHEIEADGFTVAVGYGKFRHWGKRDPSARNAIAVYDHDTRTIHLNPRSSHWHDPAGEAARNHRLGNWSSGHPSHLARHEVGHGKHARRDEEAYAYAVNTSFSEATRRSLIGKVSHRALQENIGEFIAEVYAGRRAGKVYDDHVMEIYEGFRGP